MAAEVLPVQRPKSLQDSNFNIKDFKWNTEIEVDLIEDVRLRPYLWDPQHPLFKKKSTKKQAYVEIAKNLVRKWPDLNNNSLFSHELVMAKFQNMRAYYRREKRKSAILVGEYGGNLDFNPKWDHFFRMSFLDDPAPPPSEHNKHQENGSSDHNAYQLPTEEDSQIPVVPKIEEADDWDSSQVSIESPPPTFRSPTPPIIRIPTHSIIRTPTPLITAVEERKKRKTLLDTTATSEVPGKVVGATEKTERTVDGDDAYGQYVASFLRSFDDPYKKELCRIKIQQAMMEVKFGK